MKYFQKFLPECPFKVADSTICEIATLLGALEAFRHAPLINNQNSVKLF